MDPANIQVQIYSKQLTMEVDARAVLSIILEKKKKQYFQMRNCNLLNES